MNAGLEKFVIATNRRVLGRLADALRGKRQHIQNVSSYVVARIVTAALYLGIVPLFLRHQGNAAYGTLGLALVAFTYIGVLDLAIGYPVSLRFSRALARDNPRASMVLRRAAPVFLGATIVVTTLLYLSSPEIARLFELSSHSVILFKLLAVASGSVIASAYFCAVLQAYNRVDWINYSRLILDFSKAGGLAAGAFASDGVTVVVAVVVAGSAAKCVAELVLATKLVGTIHAFRPAPSWRSARAMFSLGAPMALLAITGVILNTADRIYVDRVFGQVALAHYTIGADLCSRAYFIVWAITGSVYTSYVKRHATGRPADSLLKISFYVAAGVSLLIYAPIFLGAKQILTMWVGPEFARTSAIVLRLFALNAVIYLVTVVYYTGLQAQGKSRILAGGGLAAVAVMVLALALMPRSVGIEGAAIATVLAFSAQLFMFRGAFRRAVAQTAKMPVALRSS